MPLVTVTLNQKRSAAFKTAVLDAVHRSLVAALAKDPGIDPEHVMVVFQETAWENWAFAGGRRLHAS